MFVCDKMRWMTNKFLLQTCVFFPQDPSHRYDESTGLFSSYETDVKREARIEQARINAILRKQAQEREVCIMWFYVFNLIDWCFWQKSLLNMKLADLCIFCTHIPWILFLLGGDSTYGVSEAASRGWNVAAIEGRASAAVDASKVCVSLCTSALLAVWTSAKVDIAFYFRCFVTLFPFYSYLLQGAAVSRDAAAIR